jgi:hypothetical protein
MKKIPTAIALAAALMVAPAAQAGRSCEARKPTAQGIERGLLLAERAMNELDAEHARSGARVVVLARAGQDLGKYGLRYSHLGFAYKTPAGEWRIVHKLNQCGSAEASLYRQGLGEFFLDDLWRHEAAWVIPHRDVQARLFPLLGDDRHVAVLHQRAYSVVSYAWGRKYQQSNQWAIETLAAAMDPEVRTRERAQAWLQVKGYQPTTLRLGPLTRLGGRVSAANVAFDDHPDSKRFSDRIETVTVDSVFAWLQRTGLGAAPVAVRLP